jgi:hypothetical protein
MPGRIDRHYIFPRTRRVPIAKKAIPERNCMYELGIYLLMTEPARTPRREEKTRATAEPMNVHHMDFDLEARIMVESWVLSPSSARNTRTKAVRICFHIIDCSPLVSLSFNAT